MTAKKNKIFT